MRVTSETFFKKICDEISMVSRSFAFDNEIRHKAEASFYLSIPTLSLTPLR
jgi:hypothetical protein